MNVTPYACIEDMAKQQRLLLRPLPLRDVTWLRPHVWTARHGSLPQDGTAFLLAVPYVMTQDVIHPRRNVSLYATPPDYHEFANQLKAQWLPMLEQTDSHYRYDLFFDHSPIAEVSAAARSGLGVVGRHGLLITPQYGSFVFLGELITDAPWSHAVGTPMPPPAATPTCENCGACLRSCPQFDAETEKLNEPGCLSALTQKKGVLSPEQTACLSAHSLVWGCDTCQLACPHNQKILREKKDTPVPFFRASEGRIPRITSSMIDAMPEETFQKRAYAWRGKATLLRNLHLKESKDAISTERTDATP